MLILKPTRRQAARVRRARALALQVRMGAHLQARRIALRR